jgi:GMP synthase (glutamine-hydrolysing)
MWRPRAPVGVDVSLAPEGVPSVETFDALVVMGGPMGVYERAEHRFLLDEMRAIERALARGIPMVGVCLGAQLLAATLGAPVGKGPARELGFAPIERTDAGRRDPLIGRLQEPIEPLHWHGDVFALPEGATSLARSAMTEHQAFAYGGAAWGLLFHLEAKLDQVRAMAEAFPDEVASVGLTAAQLLAEAEARDATLEQQAMNVFDGFAARIVER